MKYLIDTDICIYVMNKRPVEVIEKFRKTGPGEIGMSTITVSELQYGAAKSNYPEKNQVRLQEFLAPFEILPFDQAAAGVYGELRFQLEKRGQPIGPFDLLIAAQAVGHDLTLITNNDKEFKRIAKLKIQNWVR